MCVRGSIPAGVVERRTIVRELLKSVLARIVASWNAHGSQIVSQTLRGALCERLLPLGPMPPTGKLGTAWSRIRQTSGWGQRGDCEYTSSIDHSLVDDRRTTLRVLKD